MQLLVARAESAGVPCKPFLAAAFRRSSRWEKRVRALPTQRESRLLRTRGTRGRDGAAAGGGGGSRVAAGFGWEAATAGVAAAEAAAARPSDPPPALSLLLLWLFFSFLSFFS